ncbi:uncharacterized protein FIBRA_03724 [Fibroporia radiculosa]|uniref:NAD-dependent epimerase/dehydratase domain-containing protein n=1 Tax=Fibroporia radiculosa TaxID=599839 RepID=J4HW53_9APHY|nr:uncharacterized protein FIBRA_03724 [Fibroporia radiculosa]CCM01662.1 predicted protein [Fibroporia radiculosa]
MTTTNTKTPIFLTGATGYIGGSVLTRLLRHRSADAFDITVFTRSAEKAKLLQDKFSVKAVVGTHDDLDKLEACAERAHVTFSCADSDNLPAIEAMLRGMRKRHAQTGDVPILIHTSGTGVLGEDDKGMAPSETIYSDLNIEQLKSITPAAPHRSVDLAIIDADKQGFVRTYIVLPSTIYGIASGPLVDAGITNPLSLQIPTLIKVSLARKQAGMVGVGKALWPNVHIDDVADLYIVIGDRLLNNGDEGIGHGWEGFYFGENGEHSWYDISKAIAESFVELGLEGTSEPTPFKKEELVKYFGSEEVSNLFGSNSRCRAERSRLVGWKPKRRTADMLKGIKSEVEFIVKKL